MKRKLLLVVSFIIMVHHIAAQDSVVSRVIFIGDAGEINNKQEAVIENASHLIIAGKTTVIYLGDNIYPKGFALSGNEEIERSRKIIQSQFTPMRNKGAIVYFVPGNHDWDRSGLNGLSKIKQQWAYINAQQDSMLKLIPANGCPDPYEIDVSDSLMIIAFDSEWWLFPFDKTNPGSECSCKTTKDITERMAQILYENRYKVIMLASHHPFKSFGNHGGYFSLKENVFPLTALNSNLYIPLPLIGSLYPVLRTTFPNPEDLNHPLYKTMIKNINDVFEGFPNLVHVAGHEHGLQFIKDNQIQIVSGSGSKDTYLRKNKNALFENSVQGFVVADLLTGNSMRFSYYVYSDSASTPSFRYTQPYTSVKYKEDSVRAAITTDSVLVSVHSAFDKVGKLHRFFFGENYRKEWAAVEKLPVIRISDMKGGLTPIKRGGGMQTHSLRLKDRDGKEWVLRSVEKYPDMVLPEKIRETFAKDIVIDGMSAQHPYSALVVPVLAAAAHVPHASPIIGFVSPDPLLGPYSKGFENTVCLLEEREPTGKSDNFTDMLNSLSESNENLFDSKTFLRARLLDIFLGDWDRHGDQWRFVDTKKGKGKFYVPVPRDRDQVFYTNQGIFPWIESRPWIQPFFEGFNPKIRNAGTFFFSSTMLNVRLINQFSYDEWMSITNEFVAALSDSVLEKSLKQMPANSYQLNHDKMIYIMKKRRDDLTRSMSAYYKFMYKNAFIQLSDKNESVEIKDAPDRGTQIDINRVSKKGEIKETIFSHTYYPTVTKEVRLYLGNGYDSVSINTKNSPIRLRISGTDGEKKYNIISADKKVAVFGKEYNNYFSGDINKFSKHLSNDTLNTAIVPGNLFSVIAPLWTGDYNLDDGFSLGLGLTLSNNVDYTLSGFNTKRSSSVQQFIITHSFSTNAFSIRYSGEWLKAIGKADFTMKAAALAPDNTQNFFGTGNETVFDKTGDYRKYYRVRFALYDAAPGLRWGNRKGTYFTIGPTVQYYHFDSSYNKGRVIQNTSLILSYDSATVGKDKAHAGIEVGFVSDKRNNKMIPQWGYYFDMHISGNEGLNTYSKSFIRWRSALALYKSLNAKSSIVLAERLGAEAIFGNAAFYQSAFLGGQGNLLGYRQYRYAGQYMLYNNIELRIRLANFASYILPGEFGLIGVYDIGRVWVKNDQSGLWHNGYGGGLYFAPAQLIVIRGVVVNSVEGFYPYIALGLRF
jgi:surface antigen Omp85-like protein